MENSVKVFPECGQRSKKRGFESSIRIVFVSLVGTMHLGQFCLRSHGQQNHTQEVVLGSGNLPNSLGSVDVHARSCGSAVVNLCVNQKCLRIRPFRLSRLNDYSTSTRRVIDSSQKTSDSNPTSTLI